jgi:mono/diheme cytochrome c family protein
MKEHIAVGCFVLLYGISVTYAQPTGARSTATGVFTAEQAKNGERAFQAKCATCHGEDLHSTDPEAPDLTEGAFKFGWQGKTIANRFEQIDIVAYILQFNGIPPGTQKLEPDVRVLEQIVITIP